MAEFVTVARVGDVSEGEARRVEVGGRAIALYHIDGGYFATDDTCTHAQASLSDGEITGHVVHCPLHGARFDLRTGKVLSPPAFKALRAYEVRIAGEDIQIRF